MIHLLLERMVANAQQVRDYLANSYGPRWYDVWEEGSDAIRAVLKEHFGIKKPRDADILVGQARGMEGPRRGLTVAPRADRYEQSPTSSEGIHYFRGYDGRAWRVDEYLRAIEASLGWNVPGVPVHALAAVYARTLQSYPEDWTRPETERYAASLPADLRAKMTERWGTDSFLDRLRILEPIVVMDEVLGMVSQSLSFSPSQISDWIDRHVPIAALTPLMRLNTVMVLYERVKLIEAENPERLLENRSTLDFLEAFDQRLIVQMAEQQTQRMANYMAATRQRAEKVCTILVADPIEPRPPKEAAQVVERLASAGYFKPRYPFGKPWESSAWQRSAWQRSARHGHGVSRESTTDPITEETPLPEMVGNPLEAGMATFAMGKVGA